MNSFSYGLVVLSYNHPDLSAKTLSSILNLGYPPQQIILVHNGSQKKHIDQLKEQFSGLTHFVLHQNKGYSGGANQGLKEAFKNFQQVLFLTNDIEVTALPFQISKNEDIATPLIWKRKTDQVDSLMGGLDIRTGQLKHFKSESDIHARSSSEWLYPPGTAFSISRECFEKLNGFDESFHTYWEDVDFGIRAQKMGFSIAHSPEIQLRHKIGKTCHKNRFYTLYLFQRNRKLLMKKHNWLSSRFLFSYGSDMLRLLFRICLNPNPQAPLRLWWKALND